MKTTLRYQNQSLNQTLCPKRVKAIDATWKGGRQFRILNSEMQSKHRHNCIAEFHTSQYFNCNTPCPTRRKFSLECKFCYFANGKLAKFIL